MANHAMEKDEIVSFPQKGIELTLAVEPHEKLATTWGTIKAEPSVKNHSVP